MTIHLSLCCPTVQMGSVNDNDRWRFGQTCSLWNRVWWMRRGCGGAAAAACGVGGANAVSVAGDVRDEVQVSPVVRAAVGVLGGLYVLYNNAGVLLIEDDRHIE